MRKLSALNVFVGGVGVAVGGGAGRAVNVSAMAVCIALARAASVAAAFGVAEGWAANVAAMAVAITLASAVAVAPLFGVGVAVGVAVGKAAKAMATAVATRAASAVRCIAGSGVLGVCVMRIATAVACFLSISSPVTKGGGASVSVGTLVMTSVPNIIAGIGVAMGLSELVFAFAEHAAITPVIANANTKYKYLWLPSGLIHLFDSDTCDLCIKHSNCYLDQ